MKKEILGTVVALSALLIIGAGCSSTPTDNTGAMSDSMKQGDTMMDNKMKDTDTMSDKMTSDTMMMDDKMMKDKMTSDTMMMKDKDMMMATDTMMKDKMTSDTMMMKDTMTSGTMKDTADMMKKMGIYEDYAPAKLALAKTGKVVIFFKASWCPECKAVDADITSHLNAIPKNLAILKVDYDTSAEMKKQYGVTIQHTFVQVDANGKLIKKWIGSPTLSDIASKVQ
jgi:thiol-disulfide isomerase/thioredoxin